MAEKKITPEQAAAKDKGSKATDPEEEKIEAKRQTLKIPTPADFKTKASRQALYRLNKKSASADDSAVETAEKYAKEVKAKPFVYAKGGKVKKGGMAMVHTGERVLTKAQQKGGGNMKRIACKR